MENDKQPQDDEESTEWIYGFRSGNLFIIDGTGGMHENSGDESVSYLQQTLEMYERILRQKLCRNKDDWMGLVLFGTTRKNPNSNFQTLLEFGPVTVEMLKELLNILDNLQDLTPTSPLDTCPLSDILQHAARAFDSIKIKMPFRQVNLITCNDNPLSDNPEEKHRARILSKAFHDIQVTLKVIGFGENWDFDVFYKELEMLASNSDIEPKRFRPIHLEGQVMQKYCNKGNVDLKIGDQVLITVELQSFTKRHSLRMILMNKETNEPLDSYSKYERVDSDDEDNEDDGPDGANKSSIRKWQHVGGRDILLTLDEAKKVVQLKPKGIEILKFQKEPKNPFQYHVKPVLFLGLPKNAPLGHRKFFAALYLKFQERGLMAVCSGSTRKNSKSYIYNMLICPEFHGFYLYHVPFKEEINRTMDELFPQYCLTPGNSGLNDKEKIEIMEKLMKKFRISYTPAVFPNPKMMKQLLYILALALDERTRGGGDSCQDFQVRQTDC
ncbi:ATP-dependent DNA helicase 2 subunit 1 isoform X2 [Fopius arisanus]|uniref:ATP-dependent DNA helicase 2 subunit 1 isoform X2 n=1 Tax=Fopius arisanus TaxID=64838 RepID=A0A9R1TKV6_9HYME|nr:PREDICTED: ATP-dependent DNA helicase 2 subunit 1 isoform X2 [Fopius arisanus]